MNFKSFNKIPRRSVAFVGAVFGLSQSGHAATVIDAGLGPLVETVKTVENTENGHTYHLISGGATQANPRGGLSWTQADAYAKSLYRDGYSSSLVSINSASEQEWIQEHFPTGHSGSDAMSQLIWIGLHDRSAEGIFTWENGDEVHHTRWADNLPNDPDGSHDFAYLANTPMFDPFVPKGTWNDYQDKPLFFEAFPFSAIIEVAPITPSIPEPATTALTIFALLGVFRRKK
ncbi:MAG: hypothetical protein ACJAVK_001835 [Akkermansiaceae bacterium]|jgi:hypothetical protein